MGFIQKFGRNTADKISAMAKATYDEHKERQAYNKNLELRAKAAAKSEREKQLLNTAKYRERVRGEEERKRIKQNASVPRTGMASNMNAIFGSPQKSNMKKKSSNNGGRSALYDW